MKRLYICIFLMAVIIAVSAGSLSVIKTGNSRLYYLAQEVKEVYNSGGDASSAVDDLCEYWNEYYIRVSYVAASDHLNSISSGVFRLKYLLENDSDEFLSELDSICGQTAMLYRSQFPHLYSVL